MVYSKEYGVTETVFPSVLGGRVGTGTCAVGAVGAVGASAVGAEGDVPVADNRKAKQYQSN